ncbi:MAG: tetratricopeptide repeat protein [Alphaproteobacteria bacterium]|nr:tetratricopeptide repeat protein [Alphaproteobacteria bacterium]
MQRKLTAILSADVVGYSALMEADERGTLERLKLNRSKIFDPLVARNGGRTFKLLGDGALVEFPSVVAAVDCALEIQAATEKEGADAAGSIRYRIGINLGDVIVEADDIYGDGVNVAARLQTLAPEGGIALSRVVKDQVEGKVPCHFDDIGEQRVKNIDRPVHVFFVRSMGVEKDKHPMEASRRLSMCVLPFANMSGDVEQEYFSDGISEDIITDLSKVSALLVVARNTAFQFKGKSVDASQVARQLKVTHILEGSVRKAGGRVRITAQLIDGISGGHIWAERYDRDLNDIFALQDEISEAIVKALKLTLLQGERKAIEQRGTKSVEAYNLYLMARQLYLAGQITSLRGSDAIIRLCKGAVKIDSNYALAWSLLALTQAVRTADRTPDRGLEAAERALALDGSSAEAHVAKGRVQSNLRRYEEAAQEYEIALSLDPELPEANMNAGYLYCSQRKYERAIPLLEKASDLSNSPNPTVLLLFSYRATNDSAGERSAARRLLERAEPMLAQEPDNTNAMGFLALALSSLGNTERAKEIINRGLLLEPDNVVTKINFARALAILGEVGAATDFVKELVATMPTVTDRDLLHISSNTPLAENPSFKELVAGMRRFSTPSKPA